jgi:hypothetical protein
MNGWRTATPGEWIWRGCQVNPSASIGKWTMINDDETVVSIQPDGREETRPTGSDGLYEQGILVDDKLVYTYDGLMRPIVYSVALIRPPKTS